VTEAAAALRTVRVRTEVAALPRTFDYAVPAAWDHDVRVGTRVRVPLHGRSVRGWVVATAAGVTDAPPGVELLPLKSWLGWGPPEDVIELAEWAAWRWAGTPAFFLRTASPETIVRSLPRTPPFGSRSVPTTTSSPWARALDHGPAETIVRLPPATDLIDLVLSVVADERIRQREGSTVVLVPSTGWAERLLARLSRRGVPATSSWNEARAGWPVVVGTRSGAWAPVPSLAGAVVLDAHDPAYREESTPTYSAVDVLRERARRMGAPCLLVSPVPPVEMTATGQLETLAPTPHDERAGWPALEPVDRRGADPRSGLFSEEFVRLARSVLDDQAGTERGPLVCVYNRTGGARLLACAHCGELAQCARCSAAVLRPKAEEVLRCPRCGETRPVVCSHCGRLRMKALRVGVSRLREELAALLGVEVGEVAGPRSDLPADAAVTAQRALIGTEAVLHRVRRAAAVCFLDIDLHLLAPRLSATEDALSLIVRAGRLVGPRGSGPAWARVQAQTRVPDHPVLVAAAAGDPVRVLEVEADIRRASALPPFSSLALVSGTLAGTYAEAVEEAATADPRVSITALDESRFLVQAPDHRELCDLLAATPRPAGRGLRVEVDPTNL
jgi:primosomal protein N' (replication factor Y) (superfamily II helicase)